MANNIWLKSIDLRHSDQETEVIAICVYLQSLNSFSQNHHLHQVLTWKKMEYYLPEY